MGSAQRDHDVIVAAEQLEHVIMTTKLDEENHEEALVLNFMLCTSNLGTGREMTTLCKRGVDYSQKRLLDAWRRFRDALDRRTNGPRDDVVEFEVTGATENMLTLKNGEATFVLMGGPIFKLDPNKPVEGQKIQARVK